MKIIGLAGKKFSGKSTVAKKLIEQVGHKKWQVRRESVAYPMKAACHIIFGGTQDHWFGDRKETKLEDWDLIPRDIMKRTSDVLKKEFGETLWTHHLRLHLNAVKSYEDLVVIIDDVRFDEECRLIQEFGGKVFRVIKNGQISTDTHNSEAGVSDALVYANLLADGGDHIQLTKNAAQIIAEYQLG